MQHPWILPWMPLGASLHLGMPLGGLAIPCGLSPSAAAGYITAPHGSTQASYHLVPTLHGVPTLVPHALPRHGTRPKVTEMGAAAGLISEGAGTPSEKRKAEDGDVSKEVKRAKIETRALKAKRPGFTEERYNETEYYIDNGLRKVHPYYFTFTTFTKGRWVGERILDIFAKEFRAHPVEEYERCIKAGTLTVNYMPVEVDYRLKHNDLLANIVHRHERPVIGDRIEIVHCDEDLVVVHKPPSVPVHPCGRYRHNTVVFILAKEHNLRNLRTIHRLDRLTSGLLLFGRTPKKAREMEQQIRTRQVLKEYVCRVEGQFPEEEIEVTEPIEVISYKIGVCKVSPKGKDCRTHFKKLTYDVTCNTSVVLARPHTGRMHQIRVHLQFLGYPIVNDPLYNHVVFGPEKGKQGQVGKSDDDLIKDLISIHNAENWLGGDGDDTGGGNGSGDLGALPLFDSTNMAAGNATVAAGTPPATDTVNHKEVEAVPTEQKEENGSNEVIDPHCFECRVKFRDPRPEDLMMYLHAWRYQGPNWSFETKLPAWAGQDWSHPPPATFANAIASTSPPTSTSTTTR